MAFSYGFYNSLNGDRKYNAIQISEIFDGIINDGIYATIGDCMMVRESDQSNKVIIGSGRGWFDHTWNYNDADILFDCNPSDLINKRIDAVVLDINQYETFRMNSIKYVVGVPDANPVKPTLIKSGTHFQYPLAYITREPNSNIITQANIENTVGTSECPFVTGIIETINTDDLIIQWKAQWDDFVITNQEDFLTWYEGLKDIFDESAAAHLQLEIDSITEQEFNRYYGLITSTTTIDDSVSNKTTITSQTSEADINTSIDINKMTNVDVITTTIIPKTGSYNYVKTTNIKYGTTDTIETTYSRNSK